MSNLVVIPEELIRRHQAAALAHVLTRADAVEPELFGVLPGGEWRFGLSVNL